MNTTNTTNTAAVETMRTAIGQLLNEFGERQWQSGRGVQHKSLEDAFEAVIERAALAAVAQPVLTDAYVGAREDLAIWKKRALEAEALNRKFAASVNGPTFMGEPSAQAAPTDAEIVALADETRTGEPGRDGYILPISFARAVLAKFGAPAPAASEALITIESSLRFRLACAKDDAEQLEFENRRLRERVAGLKAVPASQPVAAPAGMEPVAWRLHPFDYGIGSEGVYALTQTEHLRGTWIKKGWAPEPLYTAAQVQAMLELRVVDGESPFQ